MPAAPGYLFCFGLGYTALTLARGLLAEGWRLAGTTRSPEKRDALRAEGIEAHLFAGGRPLDPGALAGATHLLTSIAPDEAGDPVLDEHGADLRRLRPGPAWIGYLGTTAVYGDRGGAWVDEETPVAPTSERGRRRVAAERGWLALDPPAHVFRLAGIYGPGARNALAQLRAGTAKRVVKPGQVFSRVHVEDIAAVLRASMARPDPGRVYNVCDDEPAPPQDVVAHAAALLGLAPPPEVPFAAAGLSPMARSFYADNRRVRNDRIRRELGVRLRHPTYREGLAAVLGSAPAAP
jgi:nucleoside-diphosphate-sugar epimerase